MRLQVRLGPPASGRTEAMIDLVREACSAAQRVWWIGLPAQRPGIFRRVTADGYTALGLEVMNSQQMYYRLLAGPDFVDLRPLVVGTARLVRVAEALAASIGGLPSPGEAKLFAAAIAETKRYGLGVSDLRAAVHATAGDVEIARLASVFEAYEGVKNEGWDYDDVRSQAAALVASERFAALYRDERARERATLPELVVVDGLRELGPLDLKVLVELAELLPVHLTLPEAPTPYPGLEEDRLTISLTPPRPAAAAGVVERYLAPNAVAEARFVMRSLKRDLAAGGLDALDLGVVAPPGTATAVRALAEEYGVPLMDETPWALADTPEGATLLDLLELARQPTASRLLAVPELTPLASEALRLGVGGVDALSRLAQELGLEDGWRRWLELLSVGHEPVEWTRWLLSEVLVLVHPEPDPAFVSRVLVMAQEAAVLGRGDGFSVWLAALLRDARTSANAAGGVALLDAKLVSGRRFKRLYVMGAVEGAYRAAEREDYFISEDLRAGVGTTAAVTQLPWPRRFQGRDEDVAAELLSRADVTVVSAPQAGPEGTMQPDHRLFGAAADSPPPLPEVPAGSVLELGGGTPYRPEFTAVDPAWAAPGTPDRANTGAPVPADYAVGAEFLRRYDECGFRAWGTAVLPAPLTDEPPEWQRLIRALTSHSELSEPRLAALAAEFPAFAEWLNDHAERLMRLTWGAPFRHGASGVTAAVHAGERLQLGSRGLERANVYRFVAPAAEEVDWNWGREQQRGRWAEYLAADSLLHHRRRPVDAVEVVLWPLLGEPLVVDRTKSQYVKGRLEWVSEAASAALERLRQGDVSPKPGYHCGTCPIFEVCREGRRS